MQTTTKCRWRKRTSEETLYRQRFLPLAHSERIMRDSRMFLAPVAVQTDSHTLAHQASMPLQWAYIWNGGQLAQKHCAQIKKVVEVLSFTWQAARWVVRTAVLRSMKTVVLNLYPSPYLQAIGNHSRLSTHGMTRLSTSIKSTRLSRCLTSCTLRIVKIGTILLKSRSALCNLRLTNWKGHRTNYCGIGQMALYVCGHLVKAQRWRDK